MAITDTETKAVEQANTPKTEVANTDATTPAAATPATTTPAATTPAAPAQTPAAGTTQPTTTTPNMPAYADPNRVAGIQSMYDNQLNSQKASLQAAFDKNLGDLEANRDKISKEYDAQRNAAAVDFERNRRNLNQQIASSGLNTGTAAQSQLALQQQYNKMRGTLGASEGEANAALDKSIADLKIEYQNNINKAVADNDYNKAAAMLDEWNVAYQQAMTKAQSLAQYGDFSGYADLYGADAVRQMTKVWQLQNPLIAYNMGQISAAEYKQITGKTPPGYSSYSGGTGGPPPEGPPGGDDGDDLSEFEQTLTGDGTGGNATIPMSERRTANLDGPSSSEHRKGSSWYTSYAYVSDRLNYMAANDPEYRSLLGLVD